MKKLDIFKSMEEEFSEIGMNDEDSSKIVKEMKDATNHAAQALQLLRRIMGDTHGTKPALRRTAYDSIKWASAICGLFHEIE